MASHPIASYNLSQHFPYSFLGDNANNYGFPTVSPSGAHIAYFYGQQLIIRTTSTAEIDPSFQEGSEAGIDTNTIPPISLLNIKNIIDFGPVFDSSFTDSLNPMNSYNNAETKDRYRQHIIMKWDSSFFHRNNQNSEEEEEEEEANESNLRSSVVIEDRLAVAVGFEIFIFIVSSNDSPTDDQNSRQNSQEYKSYENQNVDVQALRSAADSIIQIPPSLLLKSAFTDQTESELYRSVFTHQANTSRAFHGVASNRPQTNKQNTRLANLKRQWNGPNGGNNNSSNTISTRNNGSESKQADMVAAAAEAGLSVCDIQWLQGYTKNEEQVVRICVYLGENPSINNRKFNSETDISNISNNTSANATTCIGSDRNSISNADSLGSKGHGNSVAILICSIETIEMVIKSPKPGFKIVPINYSNDPQTRYSHYYYPDNSSDSNSISGNNVNGIKDKHLFGIVTRDSTVDTFTIFDLVPRVHKAIPFSSYEDSKVQNQTTLSNRPQQQLQTQTQAQQSPKIKTPVLDAQSVEISPGGDFIAVLDTPGTGYNVSVFSTLSGLQLSKYQGPYLSQPPYLNVEPATGILWTRVYWDYGTRNQADAIEAEGRHYRDMLLVSDKLGAVCILDPITGKPLAFINHGTGLVLPENFKDPSNEFDPYDSRHRQSTNDTLVYYEDVSPSTGMVEYLLGGEPFDPPLVPTKYILTSSSRNSLQEIIDTRVIHMSACCGYVATVVASLPSTVFLWKLGTFNYEDKDEVDSNTKSKLICVFYHTSFIKSLCFRQNMPESSETDEVKRSSSNYKNRWRAASQLIIVTQKGNMIGIWDSSLYESAIKKFKQSSPSFESNETQGSASEKEDSELSENDTNSPPNPELIQIHNLMSEEASNPTANQSGFGQRNGTFSEKIQNDKFLIIRNGQSANQHRNQNHQQQQQFQENSRVLNSLFDAVFVNNQLDLNSFGILAWNRYSLVLFYKILRPRNKTNHSGITTTTATTNNFKKSNTSTEFVHHVRVIQNSDPAAAAETSYIRRQRQGSPQIIQDIDDSFGRRVEAEVQQREWYGNATSFDVIDEKDDTFYHLYQKS